MIRRFALAVSFLLAFALRGEPAHADCTLPSLGETREAGAMVYNSAEKVAQYCDGTNWIRMHAPGSGSGGCTSPARDEGTVVYHTASHVPQACSGGQWRAMGPVGGAGGGAFDPETANCTAANTGPAVTAGSYTTFPDNVRHVWSDGTYIYVSGWDKLYALSFDGTGFTLLDTYTSPDWAQNVWSDGQYIYLGGRGLRVLTFDGSTFTLIDTNATPDGSGLYSDGAYIYVGDDNIGGIRAFSFNGSTLTLEGTYDTAGNVSAIWGDGTRIYAAGGTGGLHAFTFDGANFSLVDTYSTTNPAESVWGDGTYIYSGNIQDGGDIWAFTFDGASFTLEGALDTGDVQHIWGDGVHIFASDGDFLDIFSFDGATFSLVDRYDPVGGSAGFFSTWGDGSYIYAVGSDGSGHSIFAASGFECTSPPPGGGGGSCTAGVTWTPRDSDRSWTQRTIASSADGTKLAAAGDWEQIYTSTDSGATWTARDSSRTWRGMTMSSDGTKMATTDTGGGKIYVSTDSGVTWTPKDSDRNWIGIVMSSDGSKLAATVDGGQIYTSTDGGNNWTSRDSNRAWRGIDMSSDGAKMAAVVENGQIYTSTDSGTTWTVRESNREWLYVAMSADGTKMAAVYSVGKIYVSTDSGVTWAPKSTDMALFDVDMSADGTKIAMLGWGSQIEISTDGGDTWTAKETSRQWHGITMSSDGSKMAASDYGGKIYTSECTAGGGDITTGLTGHWKLDDGTGSTTAVDSAGSNDGTLTNMDPNTDWVSGADGGALDFDGTDDVADAGSDAAIDDLAQMSVCTWLYPRNLEYWTGMIANKSTDSNDGWNFFIGSGGPGSGATQASLGFWSNRQWQYTTNNAPIVLDTWQHVCVTWDGGDTGTSATLYYNGTVLSDINQSDNGSTINDAANNLTIGSMGSSLDFEGSMDDVRLYNRPLSAADVQELYETTAPPPDVTNGLAGHWQFDDGTGSTATDSSGNGNDGTLVGSPTWGAGKVGQALTFNGSSQYITVPLVPSLKTSSCSIAAWVKTTFDDYESIIAFTRGGSWENYSIAIGTNSSYNGLNDELITVGLHGAGYGNDMGYLTATRSELFDGQWHHVVVTEDGS